ncbi:MAG: cupin domain-containing protein [Rhizomicrobium sp.]
MIGQATVLLADMCIASRPKMLHVTCETREHSQKPAGRGLRELIGAGKFADFMQACWPEKPALFDFPSATLMRLFALARFRTAYSALRQVDGPVMVYGDIPVDLTDGISNKFYTTPDRADAFLSRGATVEIDHYEVASNELQRWLAAFKQDLGLPASVMGKCVVYASSASQGLDMHFDAYANFVVQLSGSKTWRLAPNERVVAPLEHHDMDEPFPSEELQSYWARGAALPAAADIETVTLEAGQMLFVPRGYWHGTSAGRHSLSLNFTFGQPAALDLALSALRRRLAASSHWRALLSCDLIVEESSTPADRQLREAAIWLQRLRTEIEKLSPSDLLDASRSLADPYSEANALVRQLSRYRDTDGDAARPRRLAAGGENWDDYDKCFAEGMEWLAP